MDSWPAWCKYPLGHYVKTLGEKGAKATETEVSAKRGNIGPPIYGWSAYLDSSIIRLLSLAEHHVHRPVSWMISCGR